MQRMSMAADATLLLVVVIMIAHAFQTRPDAAEETIPPILQSGAQVGFEEMEWSNASQHVILFASTACDATQQIAPFLRMLRSTLKANGLDLIVVSNDTQGDIDNWLKDRDLGRDRFIRIVDPVRFGLVVTPTVIRVGPDGRLLDAMLGQPTAEQANRFIDRVRGLSVSPVDNSAELLAEETDAEGANALRSNLHYRILDVRDQSAFRAHHQSGALNIPFDELRVRGPIELEAGTSVVVDCTFAKAIEVPACRGAGMYLRSVGISDVTVALNFARITR